MLTLYNLFVDNLIHLCYNKLNKTFKYFYQKEDCKKMNDDRRIQTYGRSSKIVLKNIPDRTIFSKQTAIDIHIKIGE